MKRTGCKERKEKVMEDDSAVWQILQESKMIRENMDKGKEEVKEEVRNLKNDILHRRKMGRQRGRIKKKYGETGKKNGKHGNEKK